MTKRHPSQPHLIEWIRNAGANRTTAEIAAALEVAEETVRRLYKRINPPPLRPARERIPCVSCREPFETDDRVKNRLCGPCRDHANRMDF